MALTAQSLTLTPSRSPSLTASLSFPCFVQRIQGCRFLYSNRRNCFNRRFRNRCLEFRIVSELGKQSEQSSTQDDSDEDLGVKVALSMLMFYKREISPLLPKSCRYIPTCSEYSMIAYKRYGVVKGSILTAWRICRCNPLGGSGFDPPRWFDEPSPPEQ